MANAPERLRVRRYVNGRLLDETIVMFGNVDGLGDVHSEWAGLCSREGIVWRVVMDDPDTDIELVTLDHDVMMDAAEFARRLQAGHDRLLAAYQEG